MNRAIQRMVSITSCGADAGSAVRFCVIPDYTNRVVLSYVRVRSGDDGDTLCALLPIAEFRTATTVSKTVAIKDFAPLYKNKAAIIRFEGGGVLETTITDVADDVVTFADTLKDSEHAVLYVMADSTDNEKAAFAIRSDVEALQNADGFFAGKDLGSPVILELANADGNSVIEGGVALCI